MKFTTTTIRWLCCTAALAFATLVAVGGSSAAGKAAVCNAPAQACMTDAEYRALLIRSLALNRKYGLGE